MTLVLSVRGRDTIWLLADRRLSRRQPDGSHRVVRDDAVKCLSLDTTDGIAVLGYAGLGATPRGTQPSEWMSAVLRGRSDLTMEQALGVLSDVSNRELPRHIKGVPGGHTIIVPAMLDDAGFRLYSIENSYQGVPPRHEYRYTRWLASEDPPWVRPIVATGTGALHLQRKQGWERAVLRIVTANDRGQVADSFVARNLAELNYRVSREITDGTVGPRSVVVWRRRRGSRIGLRAGGGHKFFDGTAPEKNNPGIPTVTNGMDLLAIVSELMSMSQGDIQAWQGRGPVPELDMEELEQRIAKHPTDPDEQLR